MALTLEKKLITITLLILGTWISQAMSRTLLEAALAKRHEQWMAQYGRNYADSVEKEKRFKIFKDNAGFIDKFNNEVNHTYKLSVNEFSDLTNEEFLASHTGYKKISTQPILSSPKTTKFRYENLTATEIPMSMDWREKGAVTSIKNQGRCGK
jgi:C1A family cysteine protease